MRIRILPGLRIRIVDALFRNWFVDIRELKIYSLQHTGGRVKGIVVFVVGGLSGFRRGSRSHT